MKRYNFTGTFNTRDLGGYPIIGTHYTKYNSVIRSDALNNLSEKDIKLLLDLKITTIIDLRNPKMAELSPNCLTKNSLFDCYNFKMSVSSEVPKTEDEFVQSYIDMASNKESMSKIMKTIANAHNGVLFHCQEGKDRTGIVSAILLSLVGVPKQDILADYHVSSAYFIDYINIVLEKFKDVSEFLLYTKAEYMDKFLKLFNEKFYSVEEYMKFLDLTNAEILNIKFKLLA